MEKYFIVEYFSEDRDGYIQLFVTKDEEYAKKYVKKFNTILQKCIDCYSRYEETDYGSSWIKNEYVEKYFDRWYSLRQIVEASYREIELR